MLKDPKDNHPVAWFRVVNPADGSEVSASETERLWLQTLRYLPRFPGRTREIDGRTHLNFNDYRQWPGRRAKWDLTVGVSEGIVVSQWNQRLRDQGDDAPRLAGVVVDKLSGYAERARFHVCQSTIELKEEVSPRESLLDALRARKPGGRSEERFPQRVRSWKNLTETFLMELYTLSRAIASINRRYFDGQESLFPGEAEGLSELVSHVEQLAGFYNEDLAGRLESQERLLGETESEEPEVRFGIDVADLNGKIDGPANDQCSYLVDMGKAEALSLMGETKRGLEFADRHI